MPRCFCHQIEEKYPSPLTPENLNKARNEYTECIVNCAKSNNVELAITRKDEFYGFATLKFDKYAVELSQSEFYTAKPLQAFFPRWGESVQIVNDIIENERKDVFWDEIGRRITAKYGRSEAKDIAFTVVAEILKQKNIQLLQIND